MLILARKEGESIRIGTDIVIVVHRLRGGQVRVGIDAPRDVPVFREEIYQQISDANEDARLGEIDSKMIFEFLNETKEELWESIP